MVRVNTLRELLSETQRVYGNRPAFMYRNGVSYDMITYSQFVNSVFALATTFVELGYSGKRIAVIGENSAQWVMVYMAAVSAGAVIVPLDRELQSSEVAQLVKESGAVALFYSMDYSYHYEDIKESYKGVDAYILNCIYEGEVRDNTLRKLVLQSIDTKEEGFKSLMKVDLDGDALCAIVFTSGTTGVSKGVMLSHENLLSNAYACLELVSLKGVRLSLLPMHHTYELTLGVIHYFVVGGTIAINHSIKYISQNLNVFAPETLLVVPLVAETFYNNIWATIRNSGREKSVRKMIQITRFLKSIGIDVRRLVFGKIIKALGGNLKNIFCGGAPINEEVAQGYIDFGINFYIGYGITECAPLITANMYCDRGKMYNCGKAIAGSVIRIANDAEEGEIEAKGPNIMLGYWDAPESTAAVMNGEWYKTGDIGKFDSNGDIVITGRIKNIIVLRNGKNVYPEELENYLYKSQYIKEVVVYGVERAAGEELQIVAEIYPDVDKVAEDNITDIYSVLKGEVDNINEKIAFFKRIAEVKVRDVEFEKTTSRKIKRGVINQNMKA